MTKVLRYYLARLRYHIRKKAWVAAAAYMIPNLFYALMFRGGAERAQDEDCIGKVALCLRFRDEAPFLSEWLDYYIAAGIDHFFLYNNFSADGYQDVLRPYQLGGHVTLIDWPRTPASPAAENDCVRRARGRFEWVGFIDADEFVVVRDARSIPEFLSQFRKAPGVALHWYYYGSNGHERRPETGVLDAYTRRAAVANAHFKVFVRPYHVTRNRNSHNFYYVNARCAVREDGSRAYGSMAVPAIAHEAWINHYFCKSLQDYIEKASRRSTLDLSGIREPSRTTTSAKVMMLTANDVVDQCALNYFAARRRATALTRSAATCGCVGEAFSGPAVRNL